MTPTLLAVSRGLLIAAAAVASPLAQAYFVTPFVQNGASSSNGFEENGATQKSVNIGDIASASVNLADGTVRNFLEVTGPGVFGQSAGVMGDRLTFSGAQGTSLNFSFNFDGTLVGPARATPDSLLQIGVVANLRVFDANAGANSTNFAGLAGALVSDTRFLQFNDPTADLDELINEALAGSFAVSHGGLLALDVFASLSIFVSTNDNPGTYTMDFLNTGTFGLQVDPGVTYTSASGVFPGSQALAVPEPQTYTLLALGLLGIALQSRRRRD